MDKSRKKELLGAYKERRPEMGVLSFRCSAAGEEFLMPAADLPAKLNRIRFQLNAGSCPNKRLQALWTEHGEAGFVRAVPPGAAGGGADLGMRNAPCRTS